MCLFSPFSFSFFFRHFFFCIITQACQNAAFGKCRQSICELQHSTAEYIQSASEQDQKQQNIKHKAVNQRKTARPVFRQQQHVDGCDILLELCRCSPSQEEDFVVSEMSSKDAQGSLQPPTFSVVVIDDFHLLLPSFFLLLILLGIFFFSSLSSVESLCVRAAWLVGEISMPAGSPCRSCFSVPPGSANHPKKKKKLHPVHEKRKPLFSPHSALLGLSSFVFRVSILW